MVGINHLQSFYVGALYRDANVEFVPRLVNTEILFNPNLMLLLCIAVTSLSVIELFSTTTTSKHVHNTVIRN